jgi:glutathione S-transferase
MRARLALDASAQACELREVQLRKKPVEMLQASAKGTVPVLVVTPGQVIDESLDIMLWALNRNDPERWLAPERESPQEMLELVGQFDAHFKSHLDRYKYPNRFAGVDKLASRVEACRDLELLESRLARAAYLGGGEASLVDMAIAPFVRQFANVDPVWFASQPWPALHRWLTRIVTAERFQRIMTVVPVWVPGTSGVSFPFQ